MPSSSSAAAPLALLHAHSRLQLLALVLHAAAKALHQIVGQSIEDLHHLRAFLRRTLLVVNLVLCRERPAGFLPLVRNVQFVANQKDATFGHVFLQCFIHVIIAELESGDI